MAPGDGEIARGVAVVDLDPHERVHPVAVQIALGEDAQALTAWADLGVAADAVDDLLRPGGNARVVDHVVQVDADQFGEAGHHEADAGQHAVGFFVRALGGIEVEPLFRGGGRDAVFGPVGAHRDFVELLAGGVPARAPRRPAFLIPQPLRYRPAIDRQHVRRGGHACENSTGARASMMPGCTSRMRSTP